METSRANLDLIDWKIARMLAYLERMVLDLPSFDPEVAMAVAIVVFSMVLTLTVNQTNDAVDCQKDNDDPLPAPTEIYCGSYSSDASNSDGSLAAHREMSQLTADIKSSLDNADNSFVVEAKPKRTNSVKNLMKHFKNKQHARKEARAMKQTRTAVLKKLKRRSFSEHLRNLNPLLSNSRKHLLTRSRSFTVTKSSSSLLEDQTLAGKSV